MKTLFLAALVALGVGAASVPSFAASTIAGDQSATTMQQTGSYEGGN